jgi:hypothetical protein
LETGRWPQPPQSAPDISTFAMHASLRTRAPLMWLACLPKTTLRSSAVSVGQLPPRGPDSTSRFSNRRHPSVTRRCDLPQAWAPLQSLSGDPPRRSSGACTLPRFSAPTAPPTRRDPPLPGLTYPGHVASSHLPCASTPCSLGELPGVLSTRRAHGAQPFRA